MNGKRRSSRKRRGRSRWVLAAVLVEVVVSLVSLAGDGWGLVDRMWG